jgi:hypothetical protein
MEDITGGMFRPLTGGMFVFKVSFVNPGELERVRDAPKMTKPCFKKADWESLIARCAACCLDGGFVVE